jgi:hypothetical protein
MTASEQPYGTVGGVGGSMSAMNWLNGAENINEIGGGSSGGNTFSSQLMNYGNKRNF